VRLRGWLIDLSGVRQGQVGGFCEHGNGFIAPVKAKNWFTRQMSLSGMDLLCGFSIHFVQEYFVGDKF
jgi:hypothetical protein